MAIREVQTTVFYASDGEGFLTREAAEAHERAQKRKAVMEWLKDELLEEAGPCHDFDLQRAVAWIMTNCDEIVQRMNDAE